HGADLRRAFCRSRRSHPRDLRRDLAVRLGAARKPAKTASPGIGDREPGGGGETRDEALTHPSSWPGLSRPSTSLMPREKQNVDARHKAGHDESGCGSPTATDPPDAGSAECPPAASD